jgi:hypothetical protein
MPAPRWARDLAAEAIRERDCEPAVLFPPTPRDEDGSRDDLLYWLRAAERFLEAVKVGWISKQGWTRWCRIFESIPVVDTHFSALLPAALRARRLRREHAQARATERKELELAKALGTLRATPWGFWVLPRSERRRQDHYTGVAPHRPLCSGV